MNVNFPGLALMLAIGLVIFAMCVIVYTAWMLTHPPRRTYAWAVSRSLPGDPSEVRLTLAESSPPTGLKFESWRFRSGRRELPVWDIQGLRPGGLTCVVVHGWGDSRVTMLTRLPTLVQHFSRIVMLDLPGHGEAPGACTLGVEEVRDVLNLLDRLEAESGVILLGFSLGAGVAIAAAAERSESDPRIRGCIAEAPYRLPQTPARAVLALRGLPFRWNLPAALAILRLRLCPQVAWTRPWNAEFDEHGTSDRKFFDRAGLAAGVACPMLVIHSVDDEICPIADSQAIVREAGDAELCQVRGVRHLELWTDGQTLEAVNQAIARFMRRIEARNS